MTLKDSPHIPSLPSRAPETPFQKAAAFASSFGPWVLLTVLVSIYIWRSVAPVEIFSTEGERRAFLEAVGAPPSTRIIALVTDWCPACKALEQNLSSNGTEFVRLNIERSNEGRRLFQRSYELTGENSIPKIILDRNIVSQGQLYLELAKTEGR